MLRIGPVRHGFDVAVAGAGPAGAALALRLARLGWRVALIDQHAFPRDKVCGDFVGPAGLAELRDLGIASLPAFSRANRVTRAALFLDGRELIVHDIPKVEGLPDHGRVIPRTELDDWLWQAAVAAGAVPLRNRVTGFDGDADGVTVALRDGQPVRARLLVGADGSASTVSRAFQGNAIDRLDRIVAVRAYYQGVADDADRCDLFFTSDSFPGYYWLFPTGGGRANVGVGMILETVPPGTGKLAALLERLVASDPALRSRLGGARMQGRIVGWPLTTYNPARRLVGDRLMLLGDAAGLINPLNGEGIQYALESARWAADVAATRLAEDRLDRDALLAYDRQVRERMDYDMALAGLIIQLIRNRELNPVWLMALEIITRRARHDEAYARIAGGVLAGLTPARSVIGTRMILGTIHQAAMSLGVGAAVGALRHERGPAGFAGELAGTLLDLTAALAAEPRATFGWASGVVLRSARLAQHVADDASRSAVRRLGVSQPRLQIAALR